MGATLFLIERGQTPILITLVRVFFVGAKIKGKFAGKSGAGALFRRAGRRAVKNPRGGLYYTIYKMSPRTYCPRDISHWSSGEGQALLSDTPN